MGDILVEIGTKLTMYVSFPIVLVYGIVNLIKKHKKD